MSPETADTISYWANWALVLALAIGVVATALIWRTAMVKDAASAAYKVSVDGRVADAHNAGLAAGRSASDALRDAAFANVRAAEATERAEGLHATNLKLEADLVALRGQVRGREILDEQQQEIVQKSRGLKLPDFAVWANVHDPEAWFYALSLMSVLQDLGMKGRIGHLEKDPSQLGVMFCAGASQDERAFLRILIDTKVVTIGAPAIGSGGMAKVTPECSEPGLIVGRRPPGSIIRVPEATQKRLGLSINPR